MSFNINNTPTGVNNEIKIGKQKSDASIKLDNLQGTRVDEYKSLISFIERTQNIKIDQNGNGLIEGNEVSIFSKALNTLAGDNGIIEKKDFNNYKDLDKDAKEYLISQSETLANDTTNSKVITHENGDYERVSANNSVKSGKKNGVSYTTSYRTQNFEDGSEIKFDENGKECRGTNSKGETYVTSYTPDGQKIRKFTNTGLQIFYDKDKEICRMDKDNERYTYQENEDGTYQKTYLNTNETKIYNSEDKLVGGSGQDKELGNYTITPGENDTYIKKYDIGVTRIYDKNNKHIGGIAGDNREYSVEYIEGDSYNFQKTTNKKLTFKDNNEVYITTEDNKTLEHRTSSYTALYKYNYNGDYDVVTYKPNDTTHSWPQTVQHFDNQHRLTQYIDHNNKEENFTCTYDAEGNQTCKYSNGDTAIYNKQGKLISKNGQTVDANEYENNGKLDNNFNQGDTGDCWLISGLTSIIAKPGGKEFLEKQISYNQSNNSYTVTLPGVNKKYTITQEEINSADYLSNGDKDVRLFEIAMDKYLKETGQHSLDEHGTTLDGNTTEALYDALFGKNIGQTTGVDGNTINTNIFNNKNIAYTVAHTGGDTTIRGTSSDGKTYPLASGHGYSVIKADNEFVYLIDPNASFDPNNPEANLIKVDNTSFKRWCNLIMKGQIKA